MLIGVACGGMVAGKERKPVAVFTADPTSGTAPLTVTFKNQSRGVITSFRWTFGDGGTCSARNPIYTYNDPGCYIVTLTVTGPGGSDSFSLTVKVTEPKGWLPWWGWVLVVLGGFFVVCAIAAKSSEPTEEEQKEGEETGIASNLMEDEENDWQEDEWDE